MPASRSDATPVFSSGFAWRLAVAFLLAIAPAWGQDSRAPEKVVLQLKWKHQFQFAGYYAAVAKGYYRDAGFDVDIRELREDRDPVESVLGGQADFGVGASELALQRGLGRPVVALAVILQHSPLVLIARGGYARSVHELGGKRVMVLPQETELYAHLQREGLSRQGIIEVPHSFAIDDLVQGRVEALSGYSTDEPYLLRRRGFAHSIFSPRASGIDFYGDTLFTAERVLKRDPRRVSAFVEASLRGWQYAMDHPQEIADLIHAQYSKRHSREHLLFEAEEMRRLMQPQLIPIGYINPGRWQRIAEVYAEFGMLPSAPDLRGFIFDPAAPRDLTWLYRGLAAALAVALLAALAALYQMVFNRRLRREVLSRRAVEQTLQDANTRLHTQLDEIRVLKTQLEDQALRDSLTGLYNRRYFDGALERELSLARRQNYPVCLVLLDIDRFKALNDTHGHQAGDAVLQALAGYLAANSRVSDLVCRWGGEEFVVVMPHTKLAGAMQRAEIWRAGFAANPVRYRDTALDSTLSAGVAMCPVDGDTPAALLRAADAALYRAKTDGRNRVHAASPMPSVC